MLVSFCESVVADAFAIQGETLYWKTCYLLIAVQTQRCFDKVGLSTNTDHSFCRVILHVRFKLSNN